MKKFLVTALLFTFIPLQTALGVDCPASAPDVSFSTAFNGVWVGTLPAECTAGKLAKKEKKRKSVLKICIEDNADGANRQFTATVKNKPNLRLLQEDAQIRPVGRRLKASCGVPMETDDPAQQAFLELEGRKQFSDRTANMAIVIADGDMSHGENTQAGDLVATFGNCVGVVYKYKKALSSCK